MTSRAKLTLQAVSKTEDLTAFIQQQRVLEATLNLNEVVGWVLFAPVSLFQAVHILLVLNTF